MIFGTIARIDKASLAAAYLSGAPIKVFRRAGGWSVECNAGLLLDAGTDQFAALEPLVDALKAHGISRVTLEP